MVISPEFVRQAANKPEVGNLSEFVKLYPRPFACEPKIDGERVLIEVSVGEIIMANRYATTYTFSNLPEDFYEVLKQAFKEDGLYDGELYAGESLYDLLRAIRNTGEGLKLAVFDCLSVRDLPLLERKQYLSDCCIEPNECIQLMPFRTCESVREIQGTFQEYVNQGYEGIVVKPNGPYHTKWLKLKKSETYDVVVLGVKKTKDYYQGVAQSFLIGFYDRQNQQFKPFGCVSSGLDLATKEAIHEFTQKIRTHEDSQFVYVKPVVVLEIEAQEKLNGGFRSPRIKRIRFDKAPTECVFGDGRHGQGLGSHNRADCGEAGNEGHVRG